MSWEAHVRILLRDDPSTWVQHASGGMSRTVRQTRAFRKALSDEFAAMVDQSLGPGRWNPLNESSLRNLQRAGFRLAYNYVMYERLFSPTR